MKAYGISIAEGARITNVAVAAGETFPSNPDEGELFFRYDADTTIRGLHCFTGGTWDRVGSTDALTAPSGASFPGAANTGDLFYKNSNDAEEGLYVYNGSAWFAAASVPAPTYNVTGDVSGTLDGGTDTLTLTSAGKRTTTDWIFNNNGYAHLTNTDFNTVGFGKSFIQGTTNGPGIPSAEQYYSSYEGLGSDYNATEYGMQMAIPRLNSGPNPYISVRFKEIGTWGSWSKIYAGFADNAANLVGTGSIYSTTSGTAYSTQPQVRELNLGGAQGSAAAARPSLGFHWAGVVASQITIEPSGRIAIFDNPGTGYENFVAKEVVATGLITASSNLNMPSGGRLGHVITDALTYGGVVVPHYGMTFGGIPTGFGNSPTLMSGYGGICMFTGGVERVRITDTGWLTFATANAGIYVSDGNYIRNNTGSYGSIEVGGTKNGYGGIRLPSCGDTTTGMYDSAGNGGEYDTSTGWHTYYNRGHGCLGVGGSSTVSGYKMNVNGSARFEGSVISWSEVYGGSFRINSSSPTLTFQDSDNRSGFIHVNSNLCYILRGDTNATTWDSGPNGRHPMTMNLDNGNVVFSGDITAFSDVRLKRNIEVIPDALDKVKTLRGVTFDHIEQGRGTGVIAQEVQQVLPEAVHSSKVGEPGEEGEQYLTVAYGNMMGLMIEAIKELNAKVEKLQAQLDAKE